MSDYDDNDMTDIDATDATELPDKINETVTDQEDIAIDQEINNKYREKHDINKMTYVDAFVKYRGQLIICISGLSGSGKTKLAHDIAQDLKLYYINAHNFGSGNYQTIQLTKKDDKGDIIDSIEVPNYDTDSAIDWDKLNEEVNKKKEIGVVVTGTGFPIDLCKFEIDYHIHLKISKQLCLELRKEYVMSHKDKFPLEVKIINKHLDSQLMNRYTYPYYMDLRNRSKIDTWINTDDTKEVYDEAFKILMNFFEKYLRNI